MDKKNSIMISIEINPQTTFHYIQKIFSKEFPFLKLEFFTKAHTKKQASHKKDMIIHSDYKVGSFSSMAMDKVIVIHPNMLVAELEKLFEDKLHLHVQVFSKSGKVWLETIQNDTLSLQRLNDLSKERNIEIEEKNDPIDYHEQE